MKMAGMEPVQPAPNVQERTPRSFSGPLGLLTRHGLAVIATAFVLAMAIPGEPSVELLCAAQPSSPTAASATKSAGAKSSGVKSPAVRTPATATTTTSKSPAAKSPATKTPATKTPAAKTAVPATPAPASPEVLAVAESEPWMAAIAAPAAARLGRGDRTPLMIAVSFPPSQRANWLIRRAGIKNVVLLTPRQSEPLGPVLSALSPELLPIGIDPVYGSYRVARRFWQRARQAVVASDEDLEGILLGASLAGSLSAPLLIRSSSETSKAMFVSLSDLGVEEVLATVSDPARMPRWADGKDPKVRVLSRRNIQDRLVARLGSESIATLVLARAPDLGELAGPTAWLAPYLGVVRGGPVVYCRTASAVAAERDVEEFITRYQLRPRSLTILADYASIGTELVDMDAGPLVTKNGAAAAPAAPAATPGVAPPAETRKRYQVATEPCMPREPQKPVTLAVGRIPMGSLANASVMFARGLLRQRTLPENPGRVLLVGNAGVLRKPLPLGEAICRVTGQDIKNCRVPLDEFFGQYADSPRILAAAHRASLIIYEGHAAYQDLIYVPYTHVYVPDGYYEEALDLIENPAAEVPVETSTASSAPDNLPPLPPPPEKPNRLERPLNHFPVVVLQSCDSLDEELLDQIDDLGCSAVIGSMTPIHSGSGSILAHTLATSLLYRGATLGESLRDAQNYLFCLGDLKILRGLKEQAASRRVALSFRLWGDPELPVFPDALKPLEPPVTAQWTAPGELSIRFPAKRFPEAHSSQYVARMFPGSQAAGLIKKRNGEPLRRVLPGYFFRVPLPDNLPGETKVEVVGGKANQAAFRVDPLERFLYVVYLPELEKPNDTVTLRWIGPTPTINVSRK